MGTTRANVHVKNLGDLVLADRGFIRENEIRTVEIEGIVDTGATLLSLPPQVIKELGLKYIRSRRVQTANGLVQRKMFIGATITIMDREIEMSVMESDGKTPPLIGCLVLEHMDFLVDPKAQKLIPNPAHDGEWVFDML